MRNHFAKCTSGAPLHSLSRLYHVPVGIVVPPLILGSVLLYLWSPKGGCCSISDDLSCFMYPFQLMDKENERIIRIYRDFVQGQGNPPECQRFAVHDEACRVADVANL